MATLDKNQPGLWVEIWTNIKEISFLLFLVFIVRSFGFGLYQVPTGSMETTMLVGERFFADKLTPMFSRIHRGEVIAFNDPLFPYSKNKLARLFQDYIWGPSNWTKRVVGVPGDEIRGMIEDGRPVIYLNGKKLEELYVNKYPLVRVWKVDPKAYMRQHSTINAENLYQLMSPKSFDPYSPFSKQPFYRIKKERIVRDSSGSYAIYPGTAIYPSNDEKKYENKSGYWSGSDEFHVKLGKNKFWVMGDNRLGSKDSRWFGPIDGRLIHGRIVYRIWSVDSDEAWWIWDMIKHPVDFWARVRWKRFLQRVF